MDEVESVRSKESVRLGVVNHELYVWRHPIRLYRAQVNADNFSLRVFVADCSLGRLRQYSSTRMSHCKKNHQQNEDVLFLDLCIAIEMEGE
jgi:hypothetical protein